MILALLKRLVGWLRKPLPPEPAVASLLIYNGLIICNRCGQPLPPCLQDVDLIEPYCLGFFAAKGGDGIGTNPYWAGKQCFSIAAWNEGWHHASTQCGNKKEAECLT